MSQTSKKTAAASVVKITTAKGGGETYVVRKSDGTSATLITSASTTRAIGHAVKSYGRALKELADE